MKIITTTQSLLADLHTPVGLYLKLRDHFSEVLLMESSDYSSKENAQSILAFGLLKSIEIKDYETEIYNVITNESQSTTTVDAVQEVADFVQSFDLEESKHFNGIFGYTAYDAVKYFEKNLYHNGSSTIPDIRYGLYQYIVVIDHFKDTMQIIENRPFDTESNIEQIQNIIARQDVTVHSFESKSEVTSNMTDEDFIAIVTQCKEHCQRGNVFQIVPSRQFNFKFSGDEFNVYRQLRSVNPSPYLFYFDYVSYRIFGSSPEVQVKVEDSIAEVHPIAGTVKRSGDESNDRAAAESLFNDPKENAEHIMLVDLARNDLSKNCTQVTVDRYKEVQYFSHVIHLTSVVTGKVNEGVSSYQVLADAFPAGTLSGAPKHKAISIIEELEPSHRGFYGGAIGMIGFDNSLNHAIIIRSFLSQNYQLTLQAGAGIVIASQEESELKEVNNKLAALHKSISAFK